MEYLFITIKYFFKRHTKICLVAALILVIGFGLISIGHGAPVTYTADNGFSGGGALSPLNYVLDFLLLLVKLLSRLLLWFIGILGAIFTYNEFSTTKAVQIGWPLVRDLANIFFVVILLLIGFATILRISAYEYKKLLLKFILMALLINFSKTIFLFAIDASQVIMLTFVSAFKEAMVVNLVSGFGINQVLSMDSGVLADFGNIISALILALIMMIVATGTMVAYVAVLLNRIITLWILLILSPLPFLLSIVPSGSKYAGEIWSKLTKELTTGIALGFFMWLSMTILSYGVASQISLGSPADPIQGSGIKFETLSTFIVCIALLWIGLSMAAKAGGLGGMMAGKVSGALKGMGKGALGVVGTVTGARVASESFKKWRTKKSEGFKNKFDAGWKTAGRVGKGLMVGGAKELGRQLEKPIAAGARGLGASPEGAAKFASGAVKYGGIAAGIAATGGLGALAGLGSFSALTMPMLGTAGNIGALKMLGKGASKVWKSDALSGVRAAGARIVDQGLSEDQRREIAKEKKTKGGKQREELARSRATGEQLAEREALIKKIKNGEEITPENEAAINKYGGKEALLAHETSDNVRREKLQTEVEIMLKDADNGKEIEDIIKSLGPKLQASLAESLNMGVFEGSKEKIKSFVETTGAAHRLVDDKADPNSRKILESMASEDPNLIGKLNKTALAKGEVYKVLASSGKGINNKAITDLVPEKAGKLIEGINEARENTTNPLTENQQASSEKHMLSAGNKKAFSGPNSTYGALGVALRQRTIGSKSFDNFNVDSLSPLESNNMCDEFLLNADAEVIAQLEANNNDLFVAIKKRFESGETQNLAMVRNKLSANKKTKGQFLLDESPRSTNTSSDTTTPPVNTTRTTTPPPPHRPMTPQDQDEREPS